MPYFIKIIKKDRQRQPETVRCRTIFLLAFGLALQMTIVSGASGSEVALRLLGYTAAERQALRVWDRTLSGANSG